MAAVNLKKNILIKLLALNRFNVHSCFRRHYEPNVSYMFRDYVTLQLKVQKVEMDLIFLRTCLREQLEPVFIRIKLPQHIQNSKAATQLRLRVLRIEIKFKRKVLSQLHHRSKSIFSFIETMTSSTVYSKLQIIKSSIVSDKSKLWRKTLVNKLIKLRRSCQHIGVKRNVQDSIKHLLNFSKRILTEDEEEVLINGLQHVYSPPVSNERDLISNIEYFYIRLLGFKTEYYDYELRK
ncbi:unnamed protein product [Didymodactylos carnosus]|uniref:Uncharacterized protein n=1 Tax=Didymodactylos carnosus TaxID=1234261 RepID=A0A814JFK9_9BILA|nr:unnamed protein product [Didymodactylos carnosus]CAF1550649.1 unnamed protein product [Didymodactylos carnosus]CAF3805584.1 unnamed protein product [Didymodactylos carnosus]CAF4340735.1 unnamed protein product [Didymodactylos carnosus]